MPIDIFIVKNLDFEDRLKDPDNPENQIKHIGTLEDDELSDLRNLAKKLNFKCLQYIRISPDIFFNHLQAQEILNELALIKDNSPIPKKVLSIIEKAAQQVKNNKNLYIHFEGE